MGKEELIKMTVASIIGALFIFIISIILQWAGASFALISSATGILLVIFWLYDWIFDEEVKGENEAQEEGNESSELDEKEIPPKMAAGRVPGNREKPVGRNKNREEIRSSADTIKENWEWAGTGQHPNMTVYFVRWMRTFFNELAIGESYEQRWSYWIERVAISLGVLSYLWMFLIIGRSVNELIGLPSFLQPVVSVAPSTINLMPAYSMTGFLYLVLPIGIISAISWYYTTKQETICPTCGETFTLISEGRYYRPENVHPPVGPHRSKESSIVINGIQIWKCKSCRNQIIQDIQWEE
ncbi:hypothetical protein [Halalkalicoccus tibetensis]|uniref:Uncharacterized protein n=1 Tax=Halalkalicoccus tibetensis TaxID=175632 RepID=A0ABD5UZC3_9EURY